MHQVGPFAMIVATVVLAGCATAAPAQSSSAPHPVESPAASQAPTGPSSPTPRPTPASPGPSAVPGLPSFRHVYLLVMENHEFGSIVGNPSAPYINRLIAGYGLATAYSAVAHPSEPNYLALFSGSTQGVTDDGLYVFRSANLADQLQAHGKSWRVFAENLPTGCFTGATAAGGVDGSGSYARKHEPAISFADIAADPRRCGDITDFSHFDPSAADFELIVPNFCHAMHDCSISTGDSFLRTFLPRVIDSPAFAESVLFITWDEGSSDVGGGGHVATIVVSPLVAAGTNSSIPHTHYSLLRTIEDAWGLGCLADACAANDLREFFAP